MPTATDERAKYLRRVAPVLGNLNRNIRAAATRMEHNRIYGHRVVHDFPPQQLAARTLDRWIRELRQTADALERARPFLLGPPQLTEYGKKVAARFAAEDQQKENPE